MFKNNRTLLIRAIAFVLCICLVSPCAASAAQKPEIDLHASDYLSSYQTYAYPAGGGKIQIWFNVVGAGTQNELGTLRIMIYESSDNQNWTWKETYLHDSTSGMLAYNTPHHTGHVTYQGTAGKYYKGYVCFWGGSNGSGDTRYVWTSPKQAT